MNIKVNQIEQAFSFQIAGKDLGPLVADLVKANAILNHQLSGLVKKYSAGKRVRASNELVKIAKDKSVARAIAILAAPDLIMANRTGGGSLPVSFFTACHAPSVDADAFVVMTPSFQGAFLIQIFDTRWLFLAWWLSQNAALVNEPAPNMIPPPVSYESLVYMFHAVDLFRRTAMESQLEFEPSMAPSLPVSDFGKFLKASVVSHDLRWLVPAFLGLTPGLDQLKFETDARHLEALYRHDFLYPAKREGKSKTPDKLVFGNAGRAMGTEFYRSWFQAVGFETLVRLSGRWEHAHSGFLAPTGLANHLILIGTDGPSQSVNHQAMTRDALDRKMLHLFDEEVLTAAPGVEPEIEPQTPPKQDPSPQPAQAKQPVFSTPEPAKTDTPPRALVAQQPTMKKFCTTCGKQLKPGIKFCTSCGHPLSED